MTFCDCSICIMAVQVRGVCGLQGTVHGSEHRLGRPEICHSSLSPNQPRHAEGESGVEWSAVNACCRLFCTIERFVAVPGRLEALSTVVVSGAGMKYGPHVSEALPYRT